MLGTLLLLVLGFTFIARAYQRNYQANVAKRAWWDSLSNAASEGVAHEVEALLKGHPRLEHDAAWMLMCAASDGHTAVVASLLKHGAVPDAQHQLGGTPLNWAVKDDHLDTADVLLRGGAAVDFADVNGNTPLHVAAFYDNPTAIRLLVKHGANANARDGLGHTPLMVAINGSKRRAARCLQALNKKTGF
jgi:hypothetical protein